MNNVNQKIYQRLFSGVNGVNNKTANAQFGFIPDHEVKTFSLYFCYPREPKKTSLLFKTKKRPS